APPTPGGAVVMASTARSMLVARLESGMRGSVRILATVTAGIASHVTVRRQPLFRAGPAGRARRVGCVNVSSDEDRRDDRGPGGADLGALVSDRRSSRIARPRLAVALGSFLQPGRGSGSAGARVLW